MLRISKRLITFGIRRENKGKWESRAPLTPAQCAELQQKIGAKFIIQPSNYRVFSNNEYHLSGVTIDEDLSGAEVILGIKEIPVENILPNKTYFCFSHTHKGQLHNMKILKRFIDSGSTLVDYELLKDQSGRRIVAFGKYAGYAGTINCLHGLGLRLLEKGYRTPFLNIGLSHTYPSLKLAIESIKAVGREIEQFGLPSELSPLLIIVTGSGNVSQGAQEILSNLPIKLISGDLQAMYSSENNSKNKIYLSVLEAQDYCRLKNGAGAKGFNFNLEDYYKTPGNYESIFHTKFAPNATAIINGIYWEQQYPRLLTTKQTDEILANPESKLVTIADISCDINVLLPFLWYLLLLKGSIEATEKATTIDNPFFDYNSTINGKSLQLMTVDNLPAQLPKDSTQYFGEKLSQVLENFGKKSEQDEIISSATIVKRGHLTSSHAWLKDLVSVIPQKKRILILGSGYVAGPVVKYLSGRSDFEIIMGSNNMNEVKHFSNEYPALQIEELDIQNSMKLDNVIQKVDLVVSLIPATMHIPVAEACLRLGKHMVTASYISPKMQSLHDQAVMKNVVFFNEIGLDPGLDHVSAKKIIDEAKDVGAEITSFKSWCGGLPAPECADNPLMYKFSWSPRGVLLAALNEAQYRINSQDHVIPGSKLLESHWKNPFKSPLSLEGLPNRDSLKYLKQYGLNLSIPTMLRGTLRYSGFSLLLSEFSKLGLLDLNPLSPTFKSCTRWNQVIDQSNPKNLTSSAQEALKWLGVFNNEPFNSDAGCLLDAFCSLLQSKMQYKKGERDMVVMHHEFVLRNPDGSQQIKESSLIQYGDGEFSAMARTVGYPVAIAAELVIDGLVGERGVIAPLSPSIYNQMLSKLEQFANIYFKETNSYPLN